jgi:hypothetical protein
MKDYRNFSLDLIKRRINGVLYIEEWAAVFECPGVYEISTFGRLKKLGRWSRSKPRRWIPEKILAPVKDRKGYLRVSLKINGKRRNRYAHRLVAIAFIPQPDGKPDVNHKTCVKTKNHYSQLEWCTPQENNEHGKKHGLFLGANSKLSEKNRTFIKENFFIIDRSILAKKFKVSEAIIVTVGTNRDGRGEKVYLNKIKKRKKKIPRYKPIVDTITGKIYTSIELSKVMLKSPKEICRILNEERKPNTTQYRYA